MKNILTMLFVLVMSLCSVSAFALSTVADIETELNKGNYDSAKAKLEEVIKKHPDSLVARKYMLQVLDLEYAKTLKPSVEYKIHEAAIANINAEIAKAKEAERKAKKEKEDAERKATEFKIMMGLLCLVVSAMVLYYVVTRTQMYFRRKARKEEERKWENKIRADVLDINALVNRMRNNDVTYGAGTLALLNALDEDNLDIQGCLERRDWGAKEPIEQHVRNAYEFFNRHGIKI